MGHLFENEEILKSFHTPRNVVKRGCYVQIAYISLFVRVIMKGIYFFIKMTAKDEKRSLISPISLSLAFWNVTGATGLQPPTWVDGG